MSHRKGTLLSLISVLLGVGLTLGFLLFANRGGSTIGMAAPSMIHVRYVAQGGNDATNDCTNSSNPCASIQHAVEQAYSGDEVRVAGGDYAGTQVITHTNGYTYTQVVFVDKSLTLRGGYSVSNWDQSDVNKNPTVIDANGFGRGVTIIDTKNEVVTVESLKITNGDYTGLGNPPGTSNMKCSSTENCGGGLYVYNSTVELRNLLITGNTAGSVDSEGGGIYFWSVRDALMDSVTVSNNSATGGGGLAVIYQYWPVVISNSRFENNNSENGGGGIYLRSNINSLVTIEDSEIRNNQASSGEGGGIKARLSKDGLMLQMDRVYLQDNQANGRGFAIYLDAAGIDTPTVKLTNLILTGNQRLAGTPDTPEDAVISVTPPFTNLIVDLAHITAADNPVESFLYAEPSHNTGKFVTVTLSNTLLSGFVNAFSAKENTDTEVIIHHDHSLFYEVTNVDNNLGGSPTFETLNLSWGDPKLKPDYHLALDSPAIDAGMDAGVVDDIDGNTRPFNSVMDIGADEWVKIPFYLPLIINK
jgi:predicted outer membrane repeat protein